MTEVVKEDWKTHISRGFARHILRSKRGLTTCALCWDRRLDGSTTFMVIGKTIDFCHREKGHCYESWVRELNRGRISQH